MVESPYFGISGWMTGAKLLFLGLLSAWLYYRVTKQEIFLLLAGAFGLNSILAFIFLHGRMISYIGIILNILAFIPIFAILNGILCSKLYHELPRIGIPPEKMWDPDKGVSPYLSGISALIMFLILRITMHEAFKLVESKGSGLGLDLLAGIVYIIVLAGIVYATNYVMPLKETQESFVTTETKYDSIDVFKVVGEVTAVEKILVPLLFYLSFFIFPYFMQEPGKRQEGDIAGLILIGLVMIAIVRFELFKNSEERPISKK